MKSVRYYLLDLVWYSKKVDGTTKMQEVFIFCHYLDGWLPRAVIADISKFGNHDLAQMEEIINLGQIIERVMEWKQTGPHSKSGTQIGFRDLNSQIITSNEEIGLAVNTWQYYADGLHKVFFSDHAIPKDHWILSSSDYYINDENSNLSPIDLHKKLSSLTFNPEAPDHKFVVKHCVLVSDIPLIKQENIRSLRFFVDDKPDDVEQQIKDYFDVNDVSLSSEKYGFLKPKSVEQWSKLNNSKHKITNFNLVFM